MRTLARRSNGATPLPTHRRRRCRACPLPERVLTRRPPLWLSPSMPDGVGRAAGIEVVRLPRLDASSPSIHGK